MTLVDARGVEIEPGDVCLYGFGVGRSVAMAEAVVLGEEPTPGKKSGEEVVADMYRQATKVSLTPSGRVRLRVVRRSYSSGEKPVVDVAPDRLVVLKRSDLVVGGFNGPYLPPSPLPTQDEEARKRIESSIEYHKECLRDPETNMAEYWRGDTARYLRHHNRALAAERKKLKAIDGST